MGVAGSSPAAPIPPHRNPTRLLALLGLHPERVLEQHPPGRLEVAGQRPVGHVGVEPRRRVRPAGQAKQERPAGQKGGGGKAKKKAAPAHDELFDLAADPAEAKDVHAEHPEIVAKLRKALADARDRGRTRQ